VQEEGDYVDGYAVAFSPGYATDSTLFVGTRGSSRSLFKSTDGGASWTPVDTGLDASDIRRIAVSPGYGTDQTLFVMDTEEGGALPFRSTDGGASWTELTVGLPADYSQPLGFALSPEFATDGTAFASFGFGTWSVRGFFRSSDGGDTWLQANPGIQNQGSVGVVAVSPDYASDGELLLSARWNGLLGSTDAGDHWAYANGDLTDPGNGGAGIRIQDWAGENTVEGNLISNNGGEGIVVQGPGTGANLITGNRIGTDASGTSALGNAGAGIMIRGDSSENIVGAEDAPRGEECTGACNLVSGNGDDGIGVDNPGSDWNIIRGNFVGTDVTGSYAIANLEEGISLWDGSTDNWIQNNLVSGNGDNGIGLTDGASSVTITGNYVGLDASGTFSIPNGYCGVMLRAGATDNTIGGDTPEERNVISGNAINGVAIWSNDAGHNTIRGNYIGLDATGENPIGNGFRGLDVYSGYNVIGGSNGSPGGSCTGACNLVSGHTTNVMLLGGGAESNTVTGNYIGVDVSGAERVEGPTVPGAGLYLAWAAADNQIGGDTPEERNVIAGMIAMGPPSDPPVGNRIAGNYLGLNASGTACLGGSYHGISLIGTMNVIGGDTAAAGNRICGAEHHGISISDLGNRVAHNEVYGHGEDGIRVSGGTALTNTLTHNSIYDNGGLGINLVDGGNTELPAPVILIYDLATGTASGTACANCTIELYSDDGGEGRWYEAGVTADGSGNWSLAKGDAFHGPALSATATDPAGNTSEFGQDWPADPPPPPTFGAPICGVTNRSRPTFTGFAQMGSLVRVGEGALSLGEATTDDRNRWRVPAEESLADGAHVITATATTIWGTSTEAERDLTVDSTLCYDPVAVTFTQRGAVQHPRDENGCADPASLEPLTLVLWPEEAVSVRVPVAVPTATVYVEVNSVRHDLVDPDGDGVFTGSFTPPSSGALVILLAADCGAGLDTMQIGSTIDPDGYVYDAQVLAGTGITQTLSGITVTLQVSDTVRSRWVQWSAELYDQTNPQVTGVDGYFAFFTPPGDFRLVADGVSQGYAHYKSPVLTVVDAPIRYNVGLWPAEIKRYVYLPLVEKGR